MKNIPLYQVRPIENLRDMIESSARIYSEKAAFLVKTKGVEEYLPISYSQFKHDVDAMGTALGDMGLKGKRIALIGENSYQWAVSYLAIVNGTGIAVPLDRELPQNEIVNLLTRSEASALIYSGKMSSQMEELSKKPDTVDYYINMDSDENPNNGLSFRSVLEKGYALLEGGDRSFLDSQIDNTGMSMLLFTSGTTQTSKAVMLSHKIICANLMSMCSMLYIGDRDTFLSVLPLHHTYECTCGFLCQIYRGSTIAFCEGLRHIPKNLKESKATVMLGVPLIFETMYRRIWDQAAKKPGAIRKLKLAIKVSNFLRILGIDLTKKLFTPIHQSLGGHIRLFISGAAGIDPLVSKGFRDMGINLVQGYGLTECAPIVALNRDVDFKDSAAGLPLPGLEVRIDNPDSDGVGEIVVKGPSVMLGYYKDEESTAKVLKEGWFYTGDSGYTDSDGFVYITGRKKNVIVTKNGKNIYPEEIETLLNRSPYIKESLVYKKDDSSSDDVIVAAAIFPDLEKIQEEFGEDGLAREALYSLVRNEVKAVNSSLVIYKHIKDFHIRKEEFVKTTTKKIKRYLEKEI